MGGEVEEVSTGLKAGAKRGTISLTRVPAGVVTMTHNATAVKPTSPVGESYRLASLVKSFFAQALRPEEYCRILAEPQGRGLLVIITLSDWTAEHRPIHDAMYDFYGEHGEEEVEFWVVPEQAQLARRRETDLVLLQGAPGPAGAA